MADPLSITAGVLGLLGTCVKVGSALKDFYDGASFADTKVKGLLTEVESFTQILRLMKTPSNKNRFKPPFRLRDILAITGIISQLRFRIVKIRFPTSKKLSSELTRAWACLMEHESISD